MATASEETGLAPDGATYLAAARALAKAIRRHDVPGAKLAQARFDELAAAWAGMSSVLDGEDGAQMDVQVATILASAEAHACGLPVTGLRDGRLIALYPRRVPGFDPYPLPPLLQGEVLRMVCEGDPPIVRQWTFMRLTEQSRAAQERQRAGVFEVDFVDPAHALYRDGFALDFRIPPAVPDDFLTAIWRRMRAYYDIVCAPTGIDTVT